MAGKQQGSFINRVRDTGKKVTRVVKDSMGLHNDHIDYSTQDGRESTLQYLYQLAKMQKEGWISKAQKGDRYYNGKHDTATEIKQSLDAAGIPWIPAVVTDAYTHVESMIVADLPEFEFAGRDTDLDSSKARQRQYVVQYVLERNRVVDMIPSQERRINKGGIAFFKVYFDASIPAPYSIDGGEIVVVDIDGACIFPDPDATSIKDCEYIIYSYPMAARKASRVFRNELKKLGKSIWQMGMSGNAQEDTKIYDSAPAVLSDQQVEVQELWYLDDDGDVACSIQINYEEIKHIEKYWAATGSTNKSFPFVSIVKIRDENSIWGRSLLEPVIPLVDAADRELAYGLLNDAFMSNDIIIEEENAFVDGFKPDNTPGARWKMKDGKVGAVQRLGGMTSFGQRGQVVEYLQGQIERTVGNYDATMGKEPTRVTTASGIAQLNERADARKNIQLADRLNGFELLFELIDWTCLEFYDDERVIFIGAADQKVVQKQVEAVNKATSQGFPAEQAMYNMDPKAGNIVFKFNSARMRQKGQIEGTDYFPRVDCVIRAGDGIRNGKAFTLAFLEKMIGVPISPTNYKLIQAWVRLADIPDREEICDFIDEVVGQQNAQAQAQANQQQANADAQAQQQAMADQQAQGQAAQEADFQQQELDIKRQQAMAEQQGGGAPAGSESAQGGAGADIPPEIDAIMQNLDPQGLQMLKDDPQLLQELIAAIASLPPEMIQQLIEQPDAIDQLLQEIAGGGQGSNQ